MQTCRKSREQEMTALRRALAAVLGYVASVWLLRFYRFWVTEGVPFTADGCGDDVYNLKPLETQSITLNVVGTEPAKFYYVPDDVFTDCDPGDTPKYGKDLG